MVSSQDADSLRCYLSFLHELGVGAACIQTTLWHSHKRFSLASLMRTYHCTFHVGFQRKLDDGPLVQRRWTLEAKHIEKGDSPQSGGGVAARLYKSPCGVLCVAGSLAH